MNHNPFVGDLLSFLGIFISASIAGIAAILVTVAIEKWGGLHGGVLGTVPSTIVPAAIGIWYGAETILQFQLSMYIIPLGLVINSIFLLLWRFIPSKMPDWPFQIRLTGIALLTLAAWGFLAAIGIFSYDFGVNLGLSSLHLGVAWFVVGLVIGARATYAHRPTPRGSESVSYRTLLLRGLAAAASIGVAVWLAGIGIPLLSGVMTIFPAIFLTSMVSLWLSQGEAVPAGAIGPMMFGSQSVSLYGLLVSIFFPMTNSPLEVAFASLAAWVISVLSINVTVWFYLKRKAIVE